MRDLPPPASSPGIDGDDLPARRRGDFSRDPNAEAGASIRPTTSRICSLAAARHAHQVPRRPRHRQRILGHHPGDDPVRARQDAVAAPPPRRGLALRRKATATASWAPPRPRAALPLEKGRPHRGRPFPLAPALQRRSEGRGAARARAHVRLHPGNDARLTDPLVLFEEAEDTLLSMQEISRSTGPKTAGRARCRRARPLSRLACLRHLPAEHHEGLGRDHRAGGVKERLLAQARPRSSTAASSPRLRACRTG